MGLQNILRVFTLSIPLDEFKGFFATNYTDFRGLGFKNSCESVKLVLSLSKYPW